MISLDLHKATVRSAGSNPHPEVEKGILRKGKDLPKDRQLIETEAEVQLQVS